MFDDISRQIARCGHSFIEVIAKCLNKIVVVIVGFIFLILMANTDSKSNKAGGEARTTNRSRPGFDTLKKDSNVFDVLAAYKHGIGDVIRKYCQPKRNQQDARKWVNDMFIRWYYDANAKGLLKDYYPTKNIVSKEDVTNAYDLKNVTGPDAKKLDDIMRDLDGLPQKIRNKYPDELSTTCKMCKLVFSDAQIARAKELYISDDFDTDIATLSQLYSVLGGTNNNLSVPKIFEGVELFGSPFNTNNPFCSPFEIEKKFGSLGSFFNYELVGGVYQANPPFDDQFMDKMADRLLDQLAKERKDADDVFMFVVIPVWDPETQKEYGFKNYGLKFSCFDKLKLSPYLVGRRVLLKDEYPYYDYGNSKYIGVTNSHVLLLTNAKDKDDAKCKDMLNDYVGKWHKATYKQ